MKDLFHKILNNVQELPSLPTVYNSLAKAVEEPVILIEKIADIISKDQATAFKVLKVTNSPFYGFRGKIDTISKAIMYLGLNEVKNIVFSLSFTKMFSKNIKVKGITTEDLWIHSIAVGMFTRILGQAQGIKNVENYFLARVVHDIGKLVLMQYVPKEYEAAVAKAKENNCSISDAEREILNVDHSEVGMLLSERWKIPDSITNSIAYHETGLIDNNVDQLAGSVHIADFMARLFNLGFPGDNLVTQPNIEVWGKLQIPPTFFINISKKFFDDFDNTIRLLLHN